MSNLIIVLAWAVAAACVFYFFYQVGVHFALYLEIKRVEKDIDQLLSQIDVVMDEYIASILEVDNHAPSNNGER